MADNQDISGRVGVVVIGRNEGERLRRCLASLADVPVRIYVDSASSDGSVATARGMGVKVIELSAPPRLTAARGRNAGFAALTATYPRLDYVQFVDGDCEVQPGWIAAAVAALDADTGLALVFGRRRERFPDRSIYNALCDDEWNVPVGEVRACGGDILCRVGALAAIGGYDEGMIAGEDPDMSTRLRKAGWRLHRIAAEMTLHDAAILSFGQWWKRATRAGHAFAELADRHPDVNDPPWRSRCRSILIWGLGWPLLVVGSTAVAIVADVRLLIAPALLFLAWLAQIARITIRRRRQLPGRIAIASGMFIMIGKMAEASGLLRYLRGRIGGAKAGLIEYKGAGA
jgi:GT2 family glycosyltransferase